MKDWKSDLSLIKAQTSSNSSKSSISPTEVINSPNPTIALSAQLEPTEIKILQLIRGIENLNLALQKLTPTPLVKGNSKLIKQYQKDIYLAKTQATDLIYKIKPLLLQRTKTPNTNALLLEIKDELLAKENRYQGAILAQGRIRLEKEEKERLKKLANEEAAIRERKATLQKNALSIIKKFDIHICNNCDDGYMFITCPQCNGSGRTEHAHKGTIVERFTCGNLRANCEICGGLGFFSKEREVMTYKCSSCTDGKSLIPCSACHGTKLMSGNGCNSPKALFASVLIPNDELIKEIKFQLGWK